MKHYKYFSEEITEESVQELIDSLCRNNTEVLYFATNGGDTNSMEVLVSFLSDNEIKVILTDRIASCGVDLLTEYGGSLSISRNLEYILFHLCDRSFSTTLKETVSSKVLKKDLDDYNKELLKRYKTLGLSSKQLKKISEGKDVIVYRKDFNKLNLEDVSEEN
ncbi:hypothetical protein Phi4:1_gp084 [Cellulophaga phage phi4:1]|uniref:Uncharacterized protein n=3 Tax=Lightbulbvirus Cba41 TaxID=1918524 RepID=A0A0S2MWP6_9CAUD|nr:hypothetical protein Phi4:1_gp084 [Cellulophaga phage phi4:1]AGO49497.1 hypothetical protein Phi4:1_gp084 [Cellulophaga phage phi4:1]ALO80093.1 hypothetical protein Phi4113_084 [Cellulophaga phage phi4:1_13]ALO80290.1 hypothetical protein Phi4118_084 [Cellulophaga phage phi4:1_18]